MMAHQGFQPPENMLSESQNKFWWEGKGEFMWICKGHLEHFILNLRAAYHSDFRMRFFLKVPNIFLKTFENFDFLGR